MFCKIRCSDELKTCKIIHSSLFFLIFVRPEKTTGLGCGKGEEKIEKNNRNIRNEQIKSIIGFRPKDYYGQDGVDSWYYYLPDHVLHSGSEPYHSRLMIDSFKKIELEDISESFPAFITMITMVLCLNDR